jgi:ATP-dependent Clp protease ATP-binding subunit ClpA
VGEVQSLIGREDELERLICVLCRRTRKNPVLVGEPAVGKKTTVGGLAQRMTNGNVPTALAGKSILALMCRRLAPGARWSPGGNPIDHFGYESKAPDSQNVSED